MPKFTGIPLEDTQPSSGGPRFTGKPLEQNLATGGAPTRGPMLNLSDAPPQYTRDPERGAGIMPNVAVSAADDPMVKVQYLASQRFPKEGEYALTRYRVLDDGEIIYKDDDGQWYSESPTIPQRVAAQSTKAIPMVTGTVAGVATAPMWLSGPQGAAANMAITGAAGAGGEYVRQKIGEQVTGDPVSYGDVAMEGGLAIAGEGLGGLAIRGMGRNVARDISRMSAEDVDILRNLSKKYNIDLTPAELTNLPSLKAQQKALGNISETSDDMMDFYRTRAGQTDEAVGRYLDDISPVDSSEIAGISARDASAKSIKQARQARAEVAGPQYKMVDDPKSIIDPQKFDLIAQDEYLAGVIKSVKEDPLRGIKEYPDNSLPVVDAAKKQIDDAISSANRAGNRNQARLLDAKRRKLLEIADDAYPEYPAARAAFAGESPEVDALEKGIVGVIANLKDTNAQTAARRLLSGTTSGPEAVRVAKVALMKADPDAWQAVKRAFLEDQWAKASKEFATTENLNAGAKFRALLFGDKKQQAILREALSPEEYRALEDLSRVFEASGRVKKIGSDTAWNQEFMRLQRDQSTPFIAKTARVLRPQDWGRLVEEWATERNMRKSASKVLEVITSPDGVKAMKELRKVSPSSARAAVLTAHILGIGSLEGAERGVDAMTGDQQPQILEVQ